MNREQVDMEMEIVDDQITREMLYPATAGAAGIDLRMSGDRDITLLPGGQALVSAGIKIHIKDKGCAGMIIPRSGVAKHGLVVGNLVGLIDSDYQGEIFVLLWNRTQNEVLHVQPYERVAQLVFVPVIRPIFSVVESLGEKTVRGEGGFGSTGII